MPIWPANSGNHPRKRRPSPRTNRHLILVRSALSFRTPIAVSEAKAELYGLQRFARNER